MSKFTFMGANGKEYTLKSFDEMNAGEQESLMVLTQQLTAISLRHVDRDDIANAVNQPDFDPENFEMTAEEVNELMPLFMSVREVMRSAFIGSNREYDKAVNALPSLKDKYQIFISWLLSEREEKK